MSGLVTNMLALYQATNLKYHFASQQYAAWDQMLGAANAAGTGAAVRNPDTFTPGVGRGGVGISPMFGRQSAHLEAQALGAGMMYNAAEAYQQQILARMNRQNEIARQNIQSGLSLYA